MNLLFKSLFTYFTLFLLSLTFLPTGGIAENSYRIGVATGLTGSAAAWAEAERQGVELAIEEAKTRNPKFSVQLVLEDTQSTSIGTVNAVTRLVVAQGIRYIIGPTWLDTYGGALPIAQKSAALIITPSAVASIIQREGPFPRVFSTWYPINEEIRILVENIVSQGKKRIAIVVDDEPFFSESANLFTEILQTKGLSLSSKELIPVGTDDYRTVLTKLRSKKVDTIFFGSSTEAGMLSFFRQRKDLLPDISVFGVHDIEGYIENKEFSGLFQNVQYVYPVEPNEEFRTRYENRFKVKPILSAGAAFDAANLILRFLEQGIIEPDEMAKKLRVETFPSVSYGTLHFTSEGGVKDAQFVMKRAS